MGSWKNDEGATSVAASDPFHSVHILLCTQFNKMVLTVYFPIYAMHMQVAIYQYGKQFLVTPL